MTPNGTRRDVSWYQPGLLVLESLAGGPRHLTAIVKDIEETTGVALHQCHLSRVFPRLESLGLVELVPGATKDRRHRTYHLTAQGEALLADLVVSMADFVADHLRRNAQTLEGASA